MTRLAIHRESIGVTEFETSHYLSWARQSVDVKLASHGVSLTHEELSASYAIIRHNIRTYRSAGVVEVVKGKQNAQSTLQKLEACQSSSDHFEGWRYFIEKTDQKAGTDPGQATQERQKELEVRETKAMQETKASIPPPNTQR